MLGRFCRVTPARGRLFAGPLRGLAEKSLFLAA
jgi:hypothetical protein